MIEQLVSLTAAAIVCAVALLRLNEMRELRLEEIRQQRFALTLWRVLEALGLAIVAAACVGIAGEWFMEGDDFRAETVLIVGAAIFAVGVSSTLHELARRAHVTAQARAADPPEELRLEELL